VSDETLYFAALSRLSSITSGSTDFEKIGLKLINFIHPDYDFKIPEGGEGTKDGGYDGFDPIKKAKLACSLDKDYKRKINSEVKKSKNNSDLQLFYLSNQEIPEIEKKRIKAELENMGIDLIIYGIDILSQKLEKYFQEQYDPEFYDLLCLSSLKLGQRYSRGDVNSLDIKYYGEMYKKQIVIIDKNIYYNSNTYADKKIGTNPLLDFVLSSFSEKKLSSFKNIALCGIGYLGKSFLMKMTFNALIQEFSNKNNYEKYQFLPFIQFRELKYYHRGDIEDIVKNNIDPLLIFLDGLDELNESKKIDLNNEIQNILMSNNRVRFIIAGRNSSFIDIDIFHNSTHLYLEKHSDIDDLELLELITKYNGTPIADLLPIPSYRNFVLENNISSDSKLDEFYNLLVQNNLSRDKEKEDRSKNITSRMTSDVEINVVIEILSEFCYNLFINKNNVFSENELKSYIRNETYFIFVINSAIIDYQDKNNISFISNFYYEYFVSNALLIKSNKTISRIFFSRGKIKIAIIDILVIFMNCLKTKSLKRYKYFEKEITKDDIVYILLCEFDLLLNSDRYKYFISIFKKYKKEKKGIYYGRFRQVYGPLKNIDNMAQRMQQLLPDCYKKKALEYLQSEIFDFLKTPKKEDVLSFGNAVILLIPFINNLWSKSEHLILNKVSLPLIRFFLYNDLSSELSGLLSEKFIFDWYLNFNWTTGWELDEWKSFYKDISGNSCDLLSEITDNNEYIIKMNIFCKFYNDDIIRSLLFPIIKYTMKNEFIHGHGMAITVPEMISDEYETPLIKTDDRLFTLTYILKEMELNLSEILDLLVFSTEQELYSKIKGSAYNPISILEEKLYNNIVFIESKEYDKFYKYYISTDEYGFDERLLLIEQSKDIENLKIFIFNKIIDEEKMKRRASRFLHKLINFANAEISHNCLLLIKEKKAENIYIDVVYYINSNAEHILNSTDYINEEYSNIFQNEILKQTEIKKRLENAEIEIKLIEDNDIILMSNPEAMINELNRINDFLIHTEIFDEERTNIGKLFSLYHGRIKDIILYENEKKTPPVFSECALKIMEDFYRNENYDIKLITKELYEYFFKKGNFYIYFYWFFINNEQRNKKIDFLNIIGTHNDLRKNILDSLNNDVFDKFSNNSIEYFEQYNNYRWLIPFFYYYDILLGNIPPDWLKIEHILKLIVVPDPQKTSSVIINSDINLHWLIDKFPIIKPCQIIENGLKIIRDNQNRLSRIQLINYFIHYYKTNDKSKLTDDIINLIISLTIKLFYLTDTEHVHGKFQSIAQFWRECDINYIDRLFPKFEIKIITSAIRKHENDIDYQYRKDILEYCCKTATIEQKNRIIHELENDLFNKILTDKENDEVHGFLSSLGREKSIAIIINKYLNGKAIQSRYSFNTYHIGFIKQSRKNLNNFIDLFIYSIEKSTERRSMLLHIAQDGIRKNLTVKSFKLFQKRMLKVIKNAKKKSSWKVEFIHEFLFKMEQSIYP
jgi:hypothetical protein